MIQGKDLYNSAFNSFSMGKNFILLAALLGIVGQTALAQQPLELPKPLEKRVVATKDGTEKNTQESKLARDLMELFEKYPSIFPKCYGNSDEKTKGLPLGANESYQFVSYKNGEQEMVLAYVPQQTREVNLSLRRNSAPVKQKIEFKSKLVLGISDSSYSSTFPNTLIILFNRQGNIYNISGNGGSDGENNLPTLQINYALNLLYHEAQRLVATQHKQNQ